MFVVFVGVYFSLTLFLNVCHRLHHCILLEVTKLYLYIYFLICLFFQNKITNAGNVIKHTNTNVTFYVIENTSAEWLLSLFVKFVQKHLHRRVAWKLTCNMCMAFILLSNKEFLFICTDRPKFFLLYIMVDFRIICK